MELTHQKLELLIFDMDGVILDSLSTYVSALQKVLADFGITKDEKAIYQNMGGTVLNFFLSFLPEDKALQASSVLDRVLIETSNRCLKLVPGAKETLETLSRKALLSLVTNSNSKFVHFNLRRLDIEQYFYMIMPGNCLSPKKEVRCGKIIEEAGVEVDNILFVGDLPSDINTAHNVGCKSCLVYNQYSWLFPDCEKAKSSGADILISELSELLEFF